MIGSESSIEICFDETAFYKNLSPMDLISVGDFFEQICSELYNNICFI